ncbi:hypothetical protein PHLGIDRAFT_273771 [Phlebiopsis gigantea 11061_1 CR5-6]|uniref:Uncharacterized protein n=1 Tax=Phlebiopsis gigantea (strain 11061_1 CR5-6) TaxID=745531 RepID=A0A0C3NXI7_PHLG1|nr:hypothetical protein PHLGIDRAFT_273771 [Phlebiopsis gigantea 11061_1 CR5-6]
MTGHRAKPDDRSILHQDALIMAQSKINELTCKWHACEAVLNSWWTLNLSDLSSCGISIFHAITGMPIARVQSLEQGCTDCLLSSVLQSHDIRAQSTQLWSSDCILILVICLQAANQYGF